MNDEQLRENLRRLPEVRAGDGFTEAVLARVEAAEAGRTPARGGTGRWLRPALTGAVVAALVVAALVVAMTVAVLPGGPVERSGTPVADGAVDGGMDGGMDGGAAAVATAGPDSAPVDPPSAATAPDAPPPAAPTAGDRLADLGDIRPADAGTAPAEPAVTAADRAAARRLAELRRERERLRARLAVLETLPREEPRILLAGDETVELVLDLGRASPHAAEGARPTRDGPRPAPPGGGPRYH